MADLCAFHDKCFADINGKLSDLDGKMDKVIVQLETGSGNFNLLDHRVALLERICFGLVALICTAVGGAVVAMVLKW